MTDLSDPMAADRGFFNALLAGSATALAEILTDDFILVDVMSGSEIPKPALLDAVGSEQLKFEAIDPAEQRVRRYGDAAVVTGRTQMRGRFGDAPFGARSRYTHVYVQQAGKWKLASAQGTQIAESV